MPTTNIRSAHVTLLAVAAYLCLGLSVSAQSGDSQTTQDANKDWTATTDSTRKYVSPTRIIESHSQSGNRTLDKRAVQFLGSDGRFETRQEVETENLQVDASTVRTTTRTFSRDADGRKALMQVTEEERHCLPGGGSNIVRVTSNSDLNGKLQPFRREIVETRRTDSDTEQTNSTVMLPSINGGFAAAIETHEVRKSRANGTLESEKSTSLRDGAGNWQVTELRRVSITAEGKNRSTEERVFRRDAEGKLSEVSRVVSRDGESSSTDKRETVETYSTDVPGVTPDGNLHLVERTTTTQRTSATGEQITEKQLQQRNAGDPDSGVHVSVLINDTVRAAPSGEQAMQTISVRDVNGSFGVVSVDTKKSDKVLTIQVHETPSQPTK